MRESCTYGSVGALGGQPPRATRPGRRVVRKTIPMGVAWSRLIRDTVGGTAHGPQPAREGHYRQTDVVASVTLL